MLLVHLLTFYFILHLSIDYCFISHIVKLHLSTFFQNKEHDDNDNDEVLRDMLLLYLRGTGLPRPAVSGLRGTRRPRVIIFYQTKQVVRKVPQNIVRPWLLHIRQSLFSMMKLISSTTIISRPLSTMP